MYPRGAGRLAAAVMLAVVACSSDGVTPPGAEVASVTVDPESAAVPLGGTRQLTAHALDANLAEISGIQFTWSSSDGDLISVSSTGLVTAEGSGAATISATASGKTGSALVFTSQEVATVEVAPALVGLAVGESTQLIAMLADAQGNPIAGPVVIWSSDNEAVAAVSSAGLVTAAAPGTATLTATAAGRNGTGTVTVTASPVPVSSVTLQPATASVAPGGSVQLSAVTKDVSGNVLPGRAVAWQSSVPSVATVSSNGLVIGVAMGNATVTATSEGVDGTAQAAVSPSSAVASITISPARPVALVGIPLQLTATVRDAAGNQLAGHPLGWTSSEPGRADVSQTGVVTAGATGAPVAITAVAEGISGGVAVSIAIAPPATLTIGPSQATFGLGALVRLLLSAKDVGGNEVPNRTAVWTSSDPSVAGATGQSSEGVASAVVTGASAGTATITVTADGLTTTAQVTVVPLRFASIAVGTSLSCGLTTDGAAFCWGAGPGLGDGAAAGQPTPVAVLGGLSFVEIGAGAGYACGRTAAGAVHCWGLNNAGQLGTGASDTLSLFPVPLAGGLSFGKLSVGPSHACGLTGDGSAYCWGDNSSGMAGAGPNGACDIRECPTPVPVSGGLRFTDISAGGLHTCGVAVDQAAYCWGYNGDGELGTFVQFNHSDTPVPVDGGLSFASVDAGGNHTCGIVTGGLVFCWGDNTYGELGTGARGGAVGSPTPVFGGMTFAALDAGARVTCALAAGGAEYCWGQNAHGTLGNGDFSDRSAPAAVIGGLAFDVISVGTGLAACGIATSQLLYCWGHAQQGETGVIDAPPYINVPTRVAGQP
jgi:alpha-tubulin suppressor-like RCC1 family protein/uncharacterized protein YjdB